MIAVAHANIIPSVSRQPDLPFINLLRPLGTIGALRSPFMSVLQRLFLLLSLFLCLNLHAQVARTSLAGTVTDEQGKRIPEARVKTVNVATGLKRETETGSQGSYVLPNLEAGSFTVEITKEGFAAFRLRNAKLEVGNPRILDVTLSVAERTEAVNVTEAEFQLD